MLVQDILDKLNLEDPASEIEVLSGGEPAVILDVARDPGMVYILLDE